MGDLKVVVCWLLMVGIASSAFANSHSLGNKVELCPDCILPACASAEFYVYSPGDCNKFCKCDDLVQFACPNGLEFNMNLEVCDWPENAGCLEENTYIGSCTPSPTEHDYHYKVLSSKIYCL